MIMYLNLKKKKISVFLHAALKLVWASKDW